MVEYTSKLLTKEYAIDICDVINSRTNMMIVSTNKVPDTYFEWYTNHPDAFDSSKHITIGVFTGGVLVGVVLQKPWTELPLLNVYSSVLFTRKGAPNEKYDNGYTVLATTCMNEATLHMESLGYYTAYNIRSGDYSWLSMSENKYCRLHAYDHDEILTIQPGKVVSNPLFRKYLVSRPYDIPIRVHLHRLPPERR